MKIKILKNYVRLTESLASPADLSMSEDRAVADFRGFYSIAEVHTSRVQNPLVIDTMCEILDTLRMNLQEQKDKSLQIL